MKNASYILSVELSNFVNPGVTSDTNEFSSTVTTPYEHSSPSSSTVITVNAEVRGNGDTANFVYNIPHVQGIDFIKDPCLYITTPNLRLKSSYEGRWKEDLFHKIVVSGEMSLFNTTICTYDQGWLEIWSNVSIKKRRLYRRMIGNVPEWSQSLPSLTIFSPQPWFYRDRPLRVNGGAEIDHSYTFSLNVLDLVEIRDKDGDLVEPSLDCFEGVSGEIKVPMPVFTFRAISISPEEREIRLETESPVIVYDVVVHQQVYVNDQREYAVPLNFNDPVKAIFWKLSPPPSTEDTPKQISKVGIRYERTKWRGDPLPQEYFLSAEPWFKRGGESAVASLYFCNKPLNHPGGDVGILFKTSLGYELVFKLNQGGKSSQILDIYYVVQHSATITR